MDCLENYSMLINRSENTHHQRCKIRINQRSKTSNNFFNLGTCLRVTIHGHSRSKRNPRRDLCLEKLRGPISNSTHHTVHLSIILRLSAGWYFCPPKKTDMCRQRRQRLAFFCARWNFMAIRALRPHHHIHKAWVAAKSWQGLPTLSTFKIKQGRLVCKIRQERQTKSE